MVDLTETVETNAAADTSLVIDPSSGLSISCHANGRFDVPATRVGPPVMSKAASSILELLDDIFQASDSSINILNDLLHYEHLDAGDRWQAIRRFI